MSFLEDITYACRSASTSPIFLQTLPRDPPPSLNGLSREAKQIASMNIMAVVIDPAWPDLSHHQQRQMVKQIVAQVREQEAKIDAEGGN